MAGAILGLADSWRVRMVSAAAMLLKSAARMLQAYVSIRQHTSAYVSIARMVSAAAMLLKSSAHVEKLVFEDS